MRIKFIIKKYWLWKKNTANLLKFFIIKFHILVVDSRRTGVAAWQCGP